MRVIKFATAAGFAVCFTLFILASCTSAKPPINAGPDGIAIKGFDPVAYFTVGKPVKGSGQFTYTFMGATWIFSSMENLVLFKADPKAYTPQYGGY